MNIKDGDEGGRGGMLLLIPIQPKYVIRNQKRDNQIRYKMRKIFITLVIICAEIMIENIGTVITQHFLVQHAMMYGMISNRKYRIIHHMDRYIDNTIIKD